MIPVIIELPNDIATPGANASEIYTITPLTTIVNKPRVNKIAGNETTTSSGLNKLFITEKMSPANRKPQVPAVTSTLS
jgi:hypothetical protein